jgi:hypothetical protein
MCFISLSSCGCSSLSASSGGGLLLLEDCHHQPAGNSHMEFCVEGASYPVAHLLGKKISVRRYQKGTGWCSSNLFSIFPDPYPLGSVIFRLHRSGSVVICYGTGSFPLFSTKHYYVGKLILRRLIYDFFLPLVIST